MLHMEALIPTKLPFNIAFGKVKLFCILSINTSISGLVVGPPQVRYTGILSIGEIAISKRNMNLTGKQS